MDGILQVLNTMMHVILTGMFAMVPGMIVWLIVSGLYLMLRRIGRRAHFRALQRGDEVA